MGHREDRENVVREVVAAARLYRDNLVGKRFLYVFEGNCIEVIYTVKNFRHLVGVETSLPATRFYKAAVNGTLRAEQIYFSNRHPYDLCKRKVAHIKDIVTLATRESLMLTGIRTMTGTYRFGPTDLVFTLCLDRVRDLDGNYIGDCFSAVSLRDGDCFDRSSGVYAVTHIFSKSNDAPKYTDLVYLDVGASLDDLPAHIYRMLDEDCIMLSSLDAVSV